MLPLQHSKPLVDVDKPQYIQHFLENPTKQKKKRRNSGYRKRSVRMHYCKTLYKSIRQNERTRAYHNLNSICLLSCGSLQYYITQFNNLLEEITQTRANLSYRLILYWFIEYLDNSDYRFWKESFKAKIRELSNKNLEEGNQIWQAQQELLDQNIDPTRDRKPLQKHQRQNDDTNDIREINQTNRINLDSNSKSNSKHSKSGNSNSRVSSKSQDSKLVSSVQCTTYNGNHLIEKCFYTTKNSLVLQVGKLEIWC